MAVTLLFLIIRGHHFPFRKQALHLELRQAEDAADLAVGGAEVVVQGAGEVEALGSGELFRGCEAVFFAYNLEHLGEEFMIGEKFAIVQFHRYAAVRLDVLADGGEIVMRVAEHRHPEAYVAEGCRGDVGGARVHHFPGRRQLGIPANKHYPSLSDFHFSQRFAGRIFVEIVPACTPSVAEGCAIRIGYETVPVGVCNSVPQGIEVNNRTDVKLCRSDLWGPALQAFLNGRVKFTYYFYGLTQDYKMEMIVHHHKSNNSQVLE